MSTSLLAFVAPALIRVRVRNKTQVARALRVAAGVTLLAMGTGALVWLGASPAACVADPAFYIAAMAC